MAHLYRQGWCLASVLLVPLLVLASPGLLKLNAVGPAWGVLWLLPWALVDGPVSGALVGVGLGLLLDALHLGPVTVVPALAVLGWWWGRLGRRGAPIDRSGSLALLAVLGSLLLGVTVLAQQLWRGELVPAAAQILLAQALITGLLAPLVCSLQVLLWRQQLPGVRG